MRLIKRILARRQERFNARRFNALISGKAASKALGIFDQARQRLERCLLDTNAASQDLAEQEKIIRGQREYLDQQSERFGNTLSKLAEITG